MSTTPTWTVEQRPRSNVIAIRFRGVSTGWKQKVLCRSDAHWDHPHSNRVMQERHLDQALAQGCPVLDFGDLFCAMQSKKDPRHEKEDVRPEHKKNAWLNVLTEDAIEYHSRWASVWALFGYGNHETGVLKHNEYDLTRALVRGLRTQHDCIGFAGAYEGWIQLMFTAHKTKTFQKRIYYTHGRGGSSPVTKGVIKTNRRAAAIEGADIVISGHSHDQYRLEMTKRCLTDQGREYFKEDLHIQLPSYKESLAKNPLGFEANHEMAPKPVGAMWLMLEYQGDKMHVDAMRAV